jgi:hypothetical protein
MLVGKFRYRRFRNWGNWGRGKVEAKEWRLIEIIETR